MPRRIEAQFLLGNIQSGLPTFQSPAFSLAGNLTITGEPVSFPGMVGKLGISIIIVPIVAIVDAVAIAKAFGKWWVQGD